MTKIMVAKMYKYIFFKISMNVMRILTSVMITPTVKIRMGRTTVRVAMDIEVMAGTVLVSLQKLIQIMVNASNSHYSSHFPWYLPL